MAPSLGQFGFLWPSRASPDHHQAAHNTVTMERAARKGGQCMRLPAGGGQTARDPVQETLNPSLWFRRPAVVLQLVVDCEHARGQESPPSGQMSRGARYLLFPSQIARGTLIAGDMGIQT